MKHPVITAVENDTGTSPAGHSSVSLGSHNSICACRGPGLFILEWEWAHNTNATLGLRDQHHVAHKRLDGSEEWTPAWGEQALRGNQEGTAITKIQKRKGLHCKRLRKNRKSGLAIPCTIFSCPVVGSFQLSIGALHHSTEIKKKKMPRKKSKLRFRVNWVSWWFRLGSAVSLETTTLGQGPDGMLSYWQWFNENTLLFKHFFKA